MKPKLLLCLALVLSGGLFGCCIARADETNAPVSNNATIRGEIFLQPKPFQLQPSIPDGWDVVLLEPEVRMIEKTAYGSTNGRDSSIIENTLGVLDLHYSVWAKDRSIPPRLSKAVLTAFPFLTNSSLPEENAEPSRSSWCDAVQMLGETHDPAMIKVLRPFLKYKVIAGDGTMWAGSEYTPLRACDKAAMAIKQLLGDDDFAYAGNGFSSSGFRNVRDSYPKWDEWDKKIAELQKRLDALPVK
jgi:hypothetical protein